MVSKEIYETCAVVAEALPEAQREMFAALIGELSSREGLVERRARAARWWLRDAGWAK